MDMVVCWTVERTCLAHAWRHPHPSRRHARATLRSMPPIHSRLLDLVLGDGLSNAILLFRDDMHCEYTEMYLYGGVVAAYQNQ